MEGYHWKVIIGRSSLEGHHWKVIIGRSSLEGHHWKVIIGRSSLEGHHWKVIIGRSSLEGHHWKVIIGRSSLEGHHWKVIIGRLSSDQMTWLTIQMGVGWDGEFIKKTNLNQFFNCCILGTSIHKTAKTSKKIYGYIFAGEKNKIKLSSKYSIIEYILKQIIKKTTR